MKVTVTKKFKDAKTGEIHKAGDEIEVTQDRLKEIKEAGDFVKEVKEKPTKGETKDQK